MIYQRREDIPTYHASGRERLEHLADFLEDLGPDSLTFGFWYGQGKGCAVGLAAARNPWFQAQGLRLESKDSLKDCHPVYSRATDWGAISAFFEISTLQARQLFHQAGYDGELRPQPERIARKVRHMLAATERVSA